MRRARAVAEPIKGRYIVCRAREERNFTRSKKNKEQASAQPGIVVSNILNRRSQPKPNELSDFESISSSSSFSLPGVSGRARTPYSLMQQTNGLDEMTDPASSGWKSGFAFLHSSRFPHKMKSFSRSSARVWGFLRRLYGPRG